MHSGPRIAGAMLLNGGPVPSNQIRVPAMLVTIRNLIGADVQKAKVELEKQVGRMRMVLKSKEKS